MKERKTRGERPYKKWKVSEKWKEREGVRGRGREMEESKRREVDSEFVGERETERDRERNRAACGQPCRDQRRSEQHQCPDAARSHNIQQPPFRLKHCSSHCQQTAL